MDIPIVLRKATPEDGPCLAPLILLAGDGVLEFWTCLGSGDALRRRLAAMVADASGPYSHAAFVVAEAGGRIAGIASATPATSLPLDDPSGVPADRLEHLRPLRQAWDPGSLYISSLAVDPVQQGRGIGRRLLGHACRHARDTGFNRVTAHVWADNTAARHVYHEQGFEPFSHAAIPWHPLLPHRGGTLLLRRFV
ncbi:GNAT family N-acetyltransferase [Azospirillum sp.]|uniref:GNAT family N-acetyltransferase n=1 Tax=Azospirillum sp. TaxID=34012 RepID=UPI002D54213A|nr:GNAT family N-acetyltransferase [Azospirillum sp.]HYD64470.1 GNAT family N-acetyltransferase [Azospirillum sp.]